MQTNASGARGRRRTSLSAQLLLVGSMLGASATHGCLVDELDPNYCANVSGNSFCAQRHGADGPSYCLNASDDCLGFVPDASKGMIGFDGCLDEKPSQDSCYSPCGNRNSLLQDGSCLDEASDTETGSLPPIASETMGEGEASSTEGTTLAVDDTTGESASDSTTAEPTCGNGAREDVELCDGTDLGGLTCEALGFGRGQLLCVDTCMGIDTSGCGVCGNAVVDEGEICDWGVVPGSNCIDEGFEGGVLACSLDCMEYDLSGCHECGDGIIGPGEVCDGNNLAGGACEALGFPLGGTLGCTADCGSYDTAGCLPCGDGLIGPEELCDGSNLGGQTCQTQGFAGGTLACDAGCEMYDETGCHLCGNGVLDPEEECDGADLGGAACSSLGYAAGVLSCLNSCDHDTTDCM